MVECHSVFASCETSIFETMSRLALRHQAVNLGQGFPDGLEPLPLIQALAQACHTSSHQYPPMMGTAAVRQAIADHERRTYGVEISSDHCLITAGATEALAATLLALIQPGDEVVVFEPLYDSYVPIIRRAGGIVRTVRLEPPLWDVPESSLRAAIGPHTRFLLLNSPGNPSGKVFGGADLALIADIARHHDLTVICDDVYEHLTFAPHRHCPLMSLPDMAHRCVKIGSAGKIFSVTGWKVGWVIAQPDLLAPIARAHQFLTFTVPAMLQDTVAWGLDHLTDEINALSDRLWSRCAMLADGLRAVGFVPLPVQGSYFLTADIRPLHMGLTDRAFCEWLVQDQGVAAIPVSAFYLSDAPDYLVRFCFAKTEQTIQSALQRLQQKFSV
jgi:N-succinyldiaminopimelate aminotransferase